MRNYIAIALSILALIGCASVRKVESGQNKIGEHLTLQLSGPWNHLDLGFNSPAKIWTMEGIAVDELIIYPGLRDGATVFEDARDKKRNLLFSSRMPTEEIVSMFESMLTRNDSSFKLLKVEPYPFGGKKGFRFDYELIRKIDGVQLRGSGFGAVDKGQLFAMIYHAPRLTFYPRHRERIEEIAGSATIN